MSAEPVVAAGRLEIRLLGEPEVLVDGQARALPASKKTRALLGYLTSTGRAQRRERLCELLWDGPDDPRAGLRWSLAKLRPLLDAGGAVRLASDRERVCFESHGAVVDVVELRARLGGGVGALGTEQLSELARCFRGPFLEGLELSSCPVFHAWCIGEREALRALHAALLGALVERLRATPEQALPHARALCALDPLAESPRLAVLELLGALGDVRRGLAEYEDYAELLRRELGVKPSPELERRRRALGRSGQAGGAVASGVGAAHGTEPAPGAGPFEVSTALPEPAVSAPPGRDDEPPRSARSGAPRMALVGRQRERELLRHALDTAGRGTAALFVLGEPGMGKSRLLEELGAHARERGGTVLSGRAFEAELVRPYGAFIEALRAGAAQLPAPFADPHADRTRLYDAVAALLREQAQARPVVLLLDDLHWFDEASAELFHYLARAFAGAPVLLAASARSGELADNVAAQRLVRALGRERLALTIELGPLSEEELGELVAQVSPALERARVLAEAGGSPLFALEAARALLAGSRDLVGSLSRWLSERLAQLHEAERALLSWAAALGSSFDVDVLARVTGLGAAELLLSLERLERHAILRERGQGYDFAHDLLRQAAYRQMSEPRRRLVHAQIARALSAAPDPDGALASDVAHHAGLGGDAALAIRACLAAARRCLRLFATREAVELAQRGQQLAVSLPAAQRVPLSLELVALQVLARPRRSFEPQLAALALEARELGLPAVEARAFFLRSLIDFHFGDLSGAIASSLARLEATRFASPRELGLELAGTARCFLMVQRDIAGAERFVGQAQGILGQGEELDLFWSQGLLAEARGELERAAEQLERALLLTRRLDGHFEQCECLSHLLLVELDRDQHARALRRAQELAEVAAKLGESGFGPFARSAAELARAALQAEAEGQLTWGAFEGTLPALRAMDANRLLARLLTRAARLQLGAAPSPAAAARAEPFAAEALAAAARVARLNESVEARALLVEIARARSQPDALQQHLAALAAAAASPDLLARNAALIARVSSAAG